VEKPLLPSMVTIPLPYETIDDSLIRPPTMGTTPLSSLRPPMLIWVWGGTRLGVAWTGTVLLRPLT